MTPKKPPLHLALMTACLLLGALGPAGAEGLGEPELLRRALKEGKLVWYAVQMPFNQTVVDAFQTKYPGIKVDPVFTGGFQVLQRFTAEQEKGIQAADCISAGAAEPFPDLRKKKYLAQLDDLPNWKTRPEWSRDPNGHYFFYVNFKVGFMYNTVLLKEEDVPGSYAELTDPKWKDKLAIVDPSTGGFAQPFFRFVLAQPSLGIDWVRKLKENKPQKAFIAGQLAETIVSGRRPLGILRDTEALGARKKGAPVGFRIAKEGFLAHMMPVAVSRNAPHPYAARLFMNWLLSDEAQKAFEKEGVGFPLRGDLSALKAAGGWTMDIEKITPDDTKKFSEQIRIALE